MLSKREQIKAKKITDVLISSETTKAQEFLFEGVMIVLRLSIGMRMMK
jgi:hypothetical protein